MILHRLGTKVKLASLICSHFPNHSIYVEPFFGAGGLFFNKQKVSYNFMNDINSDVFNLFMMIKEHRKELEDAILLCPIHSDLLNYWKNNIETDPIQKAVRFLFLSNYTLYGKMDTLRMDVGNSKKVLLEKIFVTYKFICKDVIFTNFDFRKFIKSVSFSRNKTNKAFIYADPPYLETGSNYENKFTEQDSFDLFECLQNKGCKWAMSEFEQPFIIDQAKKRKLNIIEIGERRTIKNRRTEILITNYENNLKPMF